MSNVPQGATEAAALVLHPVRLFRCLIVFEEYRELQGQIGHSAVELPTLGA